MTVSEIIEKMDDLECDIYGDMKGFFSELKELQTQLESAIKVETKERVDYSLKAVADRIYDEF